MIDIDIYYINCKLKKLGFFYINKNFLVLSKKNNYVEINPNNII